MPYAPSVFLYYPIACVMHIALFNIITGATDISNCAMATCILLRMFINRETKVSRLGFGQGTDDIFLYKVTSRNLKRKRPRPDTGLLERKRKEDDEGE